MKKIEQQETLGRQARIGLSLLKNAVLEILFISQDEGPLQHEEIREQLRITAPEIPENKGNVLIYNIIQHLQSEGRVHYVTDNGYGWKITETEASRLKETLFD